MPKKLLATTIIIATILASVVSILGVEVVNANPVPFSSVPNTDLPSLTVDTPVSPSPLYDNNTVAMDITVVQPDAWLSYYMGFMPSVGSCYGYVYLDGAMKIGFPSTQDKFNQYNISFTGYPATVLKINGYNVSFTNEKDIQHKLTIQLYCITFSQIGNYQSNVTQDVSFTMDSSSQTISFTKTPVMTDRGPYPTATPTSFPIPTTNITPTPAFTPSLSPVNLPPNTSFTISAQATIIIIASVIVVLVIVSILLVYFRRRKGKP